MNQSNLATFIKTMCNSEITIKTDASIKTYYIIKMKNIWIAYITGEDYIRQVAIRTNKKDLTNFIRYGY